MECWHLGKLLKKRSYWSQFDIYWYVTFLKCPGESWSAGVTTSVVSPVCTSMTPAKVKRLHPLCFYSLHASQKATGGAVTPIHTLDHVCARNRIVCAKEEFTRHLFHLLLRYASPLLTSLAISSSHNALLASLRYNTHKLTWCETHPDIRTFKISYAQHTTFVNNCVSLSI